MEHKYLNKKRHNPEYNKSKGNSHYFYKKGNTRQLEPIELKYKKAKELYEEEAKAYDLDAIDLTLKQNKDKKWSKHLIETGTFEDKISSLVLYIRSNPKTTLKYIDMLLKMIESKNRRRNESVIMALKELFLETLLQNRKFLPFNLRFTNSNSEDENNKDILIEGYYDDKIHHLYSQFITILVNNARNDPLSVMRKRYMDVLYEMLIKQPEGEERILTCLIDKLGDPQSEVVNHAMTSLKSLQSEHMLMSLVIFDNVKLFFQQQQTSDNGKLHSLMYMTQMMIPHKQTAAFIEKSLGFLFELFNQLTNESSTANNNNNTNTNTKAKNDNSNKANHKSMTEQYLTLIVKRINGLFKHIKQNKVTNDQVNSLIKEKIMLLFRLSHNKSIKLTIEILRLLFGILPTQDEAFSDRYYKSLYALLDKTDLPQSKHIKEILKLLMISIIYDTKYNRVASFIKRLLALSLNSEPPFIICVLIMISQIIRNQNKLWKLIDKEQQGTNSEYDTTKRDPQYAKGEKSFFNELTLLTKHYHPSVQKLSQFVLINYNKEIIAYDGDPLVDFSLVNFLEKFIFKNPKITKEKRKRQLANDDDEAELKKFMEEDKDDDDEEDGHGKGHRRGKGEDDGVEERKEKEVQIGEHDFKFISKFNTVYPQMTSSKNYLKKLKKKDKKRQKENEDIDEMGVDPEEENDIDKFADKVIEDEYEKYNKDIDEDPSFDKEIDDAEEEEGEEAIDDDEEEEENQ